MKKIFPILMITLLAISFAVPARSKWDEQAHQRKLDYLYMEAQHMRDLDSTARMFALYQFAYGLDSADARVGAEVGPYYVQIGDRLKYQPMLDKGIAMMTRQFEEDPGDIYAATFYAHYLGVLGRDDESLNVLATLDSIYPTRKELKYKYAQALLQSGDTIKVRKAIDEFKKLDEAIGPNTQIVTYLTAANIALGDTAAALESVYSLIEKDPLNADNYVLAGKMFNNFAMPDSVIKYYDLACRVDSTDGYAYYTRAEFYRSQNDSIAFRRETLHAILNTDLDVEAKSEILINFIREFYSDSTQIAVVDSIFEQVVDRYPHEYLFRNDYENYLYSRQRYAEAADQAQIALDINPTDPGEWHRLLIFSQLSDRDTASVAIAERAITLHPDDATLHYFYAAALQKLKRYNDALDQLQLAEQLETDPDKISDYQGFEGDIYQLVEVPDSAYAAYERALATNPNNLGVMNNFAYFLAVEERELDRAEMYSSETLRDEPANPVWLDTYAWIMFKQRKYEKAKEYIDRALEQGTLDDPDLFEHAGDIYFMLGDPVRALEFWEQALQLDPDNELLTRKVAHKTYFYK